MTQTVLAHAGGLLLYESGEYELMLLFLCSP